MSDSPEASRAGAAAPRSGAASLFDLRTVIAVLFGVYGIVLVIMGLVSGGDAENLAKTGGSNLNLETGIAMLVVAALFLAWMLWRPLRPPVQVPVDDDGSPAKR